MSPGQDERHEISVQRLKHRIKANTQSVRQNTEQIKHQRVKINVHVKYSDIALLEMFLAHLKKYQERVMSASYEHSGIRSTQREHIWKAVLPISMCEVRVSQEEERQGKFSVLRQKKKKLSMLRD